MNEAIQSLGLTVALPAAIAMSTALLAGRLLPTSAKRFAAAIAFAAGYCGGCLMVQPWGDLIPSRHFHWPFYVALAAAVLGPVAALADPKKGTAWRVHLVAAMLAALVFVPTYANLQPPRWIQIPLLAAYLFVLAAGLDWLAARTSPPIVTALQALSALTVAMLTTALVTFTYGISAAIAAASLAGCFVAQWIAPQREAVRGLALSYALVIGGWSYIGALGSTPRLWALLAAALAPLTLGALQAGPGGRLTGIGKNAAQIAVVGLVLGAAALWAVLTLR